EDIWHRYRRANPFVVKGVTLTVGRGTSLGIVGESGSGKTTLARILLGTPQPTRGQVVRPSPEAGARVAIDKVVQDSGARIAPLFTVDRAIAEALGGRRLTDREAITPLLEQVGLDSSFARRRRHE